MEHQVKSSGLESLIGKAKTKALAIAKPLKKAAYSLAAASALMLPGYHADAQAGVSIVDSSAHSIMVWGDLRNSNNGSNRYFYTSPNQESINYVIYGIPGTNNADSMSFEVDYPKDKVKLLSPTNSISLANVTNFQDPLAVLTFKGLANVNSLVPFRIVNLKVYNHGQEVVSMPTQTSALLTNGTFSSILTNNVLKIIDFNVDPQGRKVPFVSLDCGRPYTDQPYTLYRSSDLETWNSLSTSTYESNFKQFMPFTFVDWEASRTGQNAFYKVDRPSLSSNSIHSKIN